MQKTKRQKIKKILRKFQLSFQHYVKKNDAQAKKWFSYNAKFQLELTILCFWTKFAQKGYLQSKIDKMNTIIEFCIFELVELPNFNLA